MFAQLIHNLWMSSPRALKYSIVGGIRQILISTGDPLIRDRICGALLWLPLSHALPQIRRSFPSYSTNLGRVARYVLEKYPDLALIDIGANIGDSIAVLRAEASFPILCLESDPVYFKILEKNAKQFSEVTIEEVIVGADSKTISVESVRASGNARLIKAKQQRQARRLADIVSVYPQFTHSKMIKIDTDGYDVQIIRGSIDYIQRVHPALFFEYMPDLLLEQGDTGFSIFSTLLQLGYTAAIFYTNIGDYLLTLDLTNQSILEDLHAYVTGRKGLVYFDIVVFHEDDSDLKDRTREMEMAFFTQARRS